MWLLVAAEGSRKARSNDVCLALEEGPLAGLEDTGFGTKMMAKGWKDQPVSRPVETSPVLLAPSFLLLSPGDPLGS